MLEPESTADIEILTGKPTRGLAALRQQVVCSRCRGQLSWHAEWSACLSCGRRFPIVDEIPVMLDDPAKSSHDEIEHLHGVAVGSHAEQQAAFFDGEAEQFEMKRPHETTRLYEFLLEEKFSRSVTAMRGLLAGRSVLTVCGGSGMDGEFLARLGAFVFSSDVSLGATRRARARATLFQQPMETIVADAERLPFPDKSIDIVYVHDGLHHLEHPLNGLAEMLRVARLGVSISEPARALVTRAAITFGVAKEFEEAGNRVGRLSLMEVAHCMEAGGFKVVHAGRYGMFYRHRPGLPSHLLSGPLIFPAVAASWKLLNVVLGRFGNKLVVQAIRHAE